MVGAEEVGRFLEQFNAKVKVAEYSLKYPFK